MHENIYAESEMLEKKKLDFPLVLTSTIVPTINFLPFHSIWHAHQSSFVLFLYNCLFILPHAFPVLITWTTTNISKTYVASTQ